MISNKYIYIGFLLSFVSVISSCLAYGYQVLIGNYFSPEEYADISFVIASSLMLATPFGGMLMKFSRDISTQLKNKKNSFAKQYFHLLRLAIAYAPIAFIATFVTLIFLNINTLTQNLFQALCISLLCVFLIFIQINSAVYVGGRDFKNQGLYQIKLNLIKIFLFLLATYTLKISIVLCLSTLVLSYFLVFIFDFKKIFLLFEDASKKQLDELEHPLRYKNIGSITLANILPIALMQLDIVFVNLIFSKELAGNYVAASLLGKSIFFVPISLSDSHFSLYSENRLENSGRLLYKPIIFTFIFSLASILFFYFFNQKVINLFFGSKYQYAADFLKYYCLFVFPIGFVFILENYYVARKQYFYVWVLLLLVLFACTFIFFFHSEIYLIPIFFGISGLIFLIVCFFNFLKE